MCERVATFPETLQNFYTLTRLSSQEGLLVNNIDNQLDATITVY